MSRSRSPSPSARSASSAKAVIARLAQPPRLADQDAIAARFIHALRLIALHERVGRDPVPELSARLGSVEIAARALQLSLAIAASWPENVRVACYCAPVLTPDEATIAALVTGASRGSRPAFEDAIDGFVRPDRAQRLWVPVLAMIDAEMRCA